MSTTFDAVDYETQRPSKGTWANTWGASLGVSRELSFRCEIQDNTDDTYWLHRAFCVFDTSSIPSDANISYAVLHLYIGDNSLNGVIRNDFGDSVTIILQDGGGSCPHNPIVYGDFNKANYNISMGQIAFATSLPGQQYLDIALNAAGLARINKGAGAITRICGRLAEDVNNNPTTATGYIFLRAAPIDYTPQLIVTYTSSETLLVETHAATSITTTTATLQGEITQGEATKRGFDYGETSGALDNEWYEEGSFGLGTFEKEITGLTPGQNLCHKAKAA